MAAPQRHRSLTPTGDFAALNPLATVGLNEVNAAHTCQTWWEAWGVPRNTLAQRIYPGKEGRSLSVEPEVIERSEIA